MAGKRHRRVRDAVHAAEATTGLQFCVYLGPAPGGTRELAERLFAGAESEGQRPAVLIAVGTAERKVEILTADWAQARVSDAACAEAIEMMRASLVEGAYDAALVVAVGHLAAVAGNGTPQAGGVELPDLFDEA
ncbi:MAG: hypothetical protein JWN67_4323 [Actinomycetia bacterium]|nr:hypothetical protein [Actinomycetes bacterium]